MATNTPINGAIRRNYSRQIRESLGVTGSAFGMFAGDDDEVEHCVPLGRGRVLRRQPAVGGLRLHRGAALEHAQGPGPRFVPRAAKHDLTVNGKFFCLKETRLFSFFLTWLLFAHSRDGSGGGRLQSAGTA